MTTEQPDNRFMEFRLGGQAFAVPLLSVREVIRKPEITEVPNMPAHFEGMMNLRGQILGVFNIRKRLVSKVGPSASTGIEVVVVIEQDGVSVGMTVDEVSRVLHVQGDMMKTAPLRAEDPANRYISSVIQSDSDVVIALDVSELLELKSYHSPKAKS